jgi:predicted nucleotidyltransferase component of viral defense system
MEFPPKNPQEAVHQTVMREICHSVADTPMVLKGGTALLLCYGLDRPSEDLDFDSPKKMGLERRIEGALERRFRIDELKTLKDTDTVQRLRLNYTDEQSGIRGRLKIETSFRLPPDPKHVVIEKGIRVYNLRQLFMQKTVAFYGRTAARDAYDLSFMLGKEGFRPDNDSLARLSQDF